MAPIEERFAMLVNMVQKDMTAFKQVLNSQQLEIAGLKAELQQFKAGGNYGPGPGGPAGSEVIGQHPLTGAPVTRAEVEADPKLKLRMAFAENEA
ncbi:MAG: hypothetical protein WAV09_03355 [Minisyncoccia bacterium]